MNSHNQPDDLFDLGLRHSLKNWTAHKEPPPDGRERLLAAVREGDSHPERKPFKFNFAWYFRVQGNQDILNVRPIYNPTIDSIYSLKANMAIL